MEEALELGVGGFILFGGGAEEVRTLVSDLQARAPRPLLFAADLERGAGQQFEGCTPLPPAAALGFLNDVQVVERAGELTAREARALGVGWIYAPVADLDVEPRNPIVGTRSFGADPEVVGPLVAAWIRGCARGGALACAKHFPGHGRTARDSHVALPVVSSGEEELARDLSVFAAAVEAGVPSVMTAHVAFPALDPSGRPATRSQAVVRNLLRKRLGFDGLVVSDALIMEGVTGGAKDPEDVVAVDAVAAGVDALLFPRDLGGIAQALERAVARGDLERSRLNAAGRRVETALDMVSGVEPEAWGRAEDRQWALETAIRTVHVTGPVPLPEPDEGPVALAVVDDDVGGPYPARSREPLWEALRVRGFDVRPAAGAGPAMRRWVAVFADPRAWKGRAGLSEESRAAVVRCARGAGLVLLFGHPRLVAELPGDVPVVCAWGGEALMQRAAAGFLAGAASSS